MHKPSQDIAYIGKIMEQHNTEIWALRAYEEHLIQHWWQNGCNQWLQKRVETFLTTKTAHEIDALKQHIITELTTPPARKSWEHIDKYIKRFQRWDAQTQSYHTILSFIQ
jgi:hypothetical protein